MIPIILDPTKIRIALVGRGELARRRLDWLRAGNVQDLAVFSDAPSPMLAEQAGGLLVPRLPSHAELAGFQLVWIADLPAALATPLAEAARAARVLVNVEDVKDWCDFHNPSVVRRGDLLMTVSTAGKSPGLAVRIRRMLERTFSAEWAERLEQVGAKRAAWKRRDRSLDELSRLTDAVIDHKGWLEREHKA